MFVSRSMTQKVITTVPEASVFDAYEKMSQHRIRHLPVIDADGRLIGIVTDRDIRSALPYSMIKDPVRTAETEKVKDLKVMDIMTTDPKTI
ncbi:MAG: CBS domain-containing protein, partial [Desulfobacterales bacterium]